MRAYIFMADGFEVLETFAPIDVLKRCGAEVITVSTNEDLLVASSQNDIFKADININSIDPKNADIAIIPGGSPGYINLRENKKVVEIVKYYLENNKYIAAICGAPTIFSENKLACGSSLTGHTGVKESLEVNHKYVGTPLHIDGKIITAIGAGHSLDFAFLIAEQFFDKQIIKRVKKEMEL